MFSRKIPKHRFLVGRREEWESFEDQLLSSIVLESGVRPKPPRCGCQKDEEGQSFRLFMYMS